MPTKPGLYANIWAKRRRIEAGSPEKMRRAGQKGAPTEEAFVASAKTAKPQKEQSMKAKKMMSGGMADMEGRAMKTKTADSKGRAMKKKAATTGYGGVMAMKMKTGGKVAKKGK
jgi:hypothetical protein